MSSVTLDRPTITDLAAPATRDAGSSISWWVSDTWELVKRNLRHVRRTPELLLDVTVQPIMFVLLFRYVFGGAIPRSRAVVAAIRVLASGSSLSTWATPGPQNSTGICRS